MDKFYNQLKDIKIISAPDVFVVIPEMDIEKIIKLATDCYMLTESCAVTPSEGTVFSFSASSSLSGGIYPCSEINCRLNNVYELSVFAALYADKIIIPNFFEYIHDHDFNFSSEEMFFIFLNRFMGDLVLMLDLKPLIQENIICINPRIKSFCTECLKKQISHEKNAIKVFKKIEKQLEPEIFKNLKFVMDSQNSIVINTEKNYVATEAIRFITLPPVFKKYIKKIPYTFNKKEVEILGLNDFLLNPIFNDLILQKYTMAKYNISYLTNRRLETEIINTLKIAESTEKKDALILEGLSHELPFVKNADINKLLNLRKKENGAFVAYRDAVRKVFAELKDEKDINIVKKAVQDNIIPEVHKIERLIEIHKDDLKDKIKGELIFDALIITAGYFASSVGLNLTEIAGGLFTARDILTDILPLTSNPAEAKRNDYYFLWKLKNRS